MRRVAILGAGAGGTAATAELTLAGHEVRLWARRDETLAPLRARGGVEYEGVLGEGCVRPARMGTDLAAALEGADCAVVCLPTTSHRPLARALAEARCNRVPVVLNPGHTGGALEFAQAFSEVLGPLPPIAELSTLTYVARKHAPQRVSVTGRARQVRAAALPGGEAALALALELFPGAAPVPDVLACDLANVNMVLHPPGAVLGAAWVEATGGEFTFYVQGMTPGVARVMRALDAERVSVARAFGHALPPLVREMQAIGTVEATANDPDDLVAAISGGEANRRIKAPGSLEHRYYREDFGHGLLPFCELAAIAAVDVPVARALLELGTRLTGVDFRAQGRTGEAMGIARLSAAELLARVRGQR